MDHVIMQEYMLTWMDSMDGIDLDYIYNYVQGEEVCNGGRT